MHFPGHLIQFSNKVLGYNVFVYLLSMLNNRLMLFFLEEDIAEIYVS